MVAELKLTLCMAICLVMLRNRLIGSVAKRYRRPDGQHFKSDGYRALAARLLPRVLAKLKRWLDPQIRRP